MTVRPRPEPQVMPGDWVRWRHPRLALARGWFQDYGPGPFEVVLVLPHRDRNVPRAYLVKTPHGERQLSALWVGPVDRA
jgi:hypothetical protein